MLRALDHAEYLLARLPMSTVLILLVAMAGFAQLFSP